MSYPFEPQRARRRGMPRDLELDLAAEEIVRQWLDGKGASRIAAERGVTQSMVRSRLIWAGELPWPDWEIYPDWLRERDGPQTTGRRVRTLYRRGRSLTYIAGLVGISEAAVRRHVDGIERTQGRPRSDDVTDDELLALREEGHTWEQVSDLTGLSVSAARHRHRRALEETPAGEHGSPTRAGHCTCPLCTRSERDGHEAARARLDPIADQIMDRLAAGEAPSHVAADLGVTPMSIHGRASWDLEWAHRLDAALTAGRDPGLPHGTTTGYARGCRCPACQVSRRDAATRYRSRRRAVDSGNAAPIAAP